MANEDRQHIQPYPPRRRFRTALKSLASSWRSVSREGGSELAEVEGDGCGRVVLRLLDRYSKELAGRFRAVVLCPILIGILCPASFWLWSKDAVNGFALFLTTTVLLASELRSWRRPAVTRAMLLDRCHELERNAAAVPLTPHLLDITVCHAGTMFIYGEYRQVVALYLRHLLPMVGPEDTESWTSGQCRALAAILATPLADHNLTIEALRVVAFTGDRTALSQVCRLADRKDWWNISTGRRAARTDRRNAVWVRKAAQECRPRLEERVKRMETAATLLRISSPDAKDSALLRAASGRAGIAAQDLLSPVKTVPNPAMECHPGSPDDNPALIQGRPSKGRLTSNGRSAETESSKEQR